MKLIKLYVSYFLSCILVFTIFNITIYASGLNHTIETSTYFFSSDSPYVTQQLGLPLSMVNSEASWVNSKSNQPRSEG